MGEKELEIRRSSNTCCRVKRQPPLLFMLGELSGETKHAIIDPINKSYNIIYFPELKCQSQCLASRFGWLLILSRETSSLFFFNPITRSKIVIPYWNHVFTLATFSAPPDSQNCTVFAIKMPKPNFSGNIIRIDTHTAGQEIWTPHLYLTDKRAFTDISQAVCNKGRLYCIDLQGRVGIFYAKYKSWNVVPSKGFDDKFHVPYIVEFNGEIYAGKKEAYGGIEKLERLIVEEDEHGRSVSAVWVRTVNNMGNFNIHLGPYGSCLVPLQEQGMKKKVLVADQGHESKCLIYENVSIDGVDDDCIYKESSIYSVKSLGGCYAPVWVQRPTYVSSPEIVEVQPTNHGYRYLYSFCYLISLII